MVYVALCRVEANKKVQKKQKVCVRLLTQFSGPHSQSSHSSHLVILQTFRHCGSLGQLQQLLQEAVGSMKHAGHLSWGAVLMLAHHHMALAVASCHACIPQYVLIQHITTPQSISRRSL